MSHTAVIILNFNGASLLRQFLPSVIKNSGSADIIVADNLSRDDSLDVLRVEFPEVSIIQLEHNYGYCGGYNRALKQVKADYYVLLNSDIEVTPNWLSPMIQLMDSNNDIAVLQPKILSYKERDQFEHAGAGGGLIDSLGYPFCRGRIFETVEKDNGQYDDECEVFWASGACLMIRSEIFHQFNGFDEDYFAHMEEIDLCWRLHRANKKVYYCGLSTIYHVGAGTLSYGHPRKIFLNFRNGLFVIFKHLPLLELFFKFPIRIILDLVACFRYALSSEWANSGAILRAHGAFVKNITRELAKRNRLHRQYPSYKKSGIKSGSIVFDYYIKGKKTFG